MMSSVAMPGASNSVMQPRRTERPHRPGMVRYAYRGVGLLCGHPNAFAMGPPGHRKQCNDAHRETATHACNLNLVVAVHWDRGKAVRKRLPRLFWGTLGCPIASSEASPCRRSPSSWTLATCMHRGLPCLRGKDWIGIRYDFRKRKRSTNWPRPPAPSLPVPVCFASTGQDGVLISNRPSLEQDLIGQSANTKLRLGLINSRGQRKGVDSLIVTDLIELARNRAITDALILSGDEDIKIGVQVAQTFWCGSTCSASSRPEAPSQTA